jgi:hypothetical protein
VNYPASQHSSQGGGGLYRNWVATSSGFGWRIAAELGGDIKRNTQCVVKFKTFVTSNTIKMLFLWTIFFGLPKVFSALRETVFEDFFS